MLIDSHAHLNFPDYAADFDEVVARAREAGVDKIINIGTSLADSETAVRLAQKCDWMYATVGRHPNDSPSATVDNVDWEKLEQLAKSPKVVGIGECGLDYFRLGENREEQITKQKQAFAEQIKLAHDVKKPLMIHCRSAFPDLIETLIFNSKFLIPDNPGIIHFFTGTVHDAKRLLDLGFCFTFGGVITFVRDYDEAIKTIPPEKILSETDAPLVTPVPYRGKRNEPAYVVEVVKKLAEIKNIPEEEMRTRILENAERVFSIKLK